MGTIVETEPRTLLQERFCSSQAVLLLGKGHVRDSLQDGDRVPCCAAATCMLPVMSESLMFVWVFPLPGQRGTIAPLSSPINVAGEIILGAFRYELHLNPRTGVHLFGKLCVFLSHAVKLVQL